MPFFQFEKRKRKEKKFSKYSNFQDTVTIKEADVSHEKAPDSNEQGQEEPNPANLLLYPQPKEASAAWAASEEESNRVQKFSGGSFNSCYTGSPQLKTKHISSYF